MTLARAPFPTGDEGARWWLAVALAAVVAQAAMLHAMGRIAICKCGTIKLWHGVVQSSENSQHVTDWYTLSHVLHGLLFYALLSWLLPRAPVLARLALAMGIEAGWEIFENTEFVINRYRAATISLDYYGDSIVNSVSDSVAMAAGFAFAATIATRGSVALGIALEVVMLAAIRDNLTLNVLMLVWPIESVARWQSGG